MKKFLIKITAYGYITDFTIMAEDNSNSIENAILDKLGKNDINWESDREVYTLFNYPFNYIRNSALIVIDKFNNRRHVRDNKHTKGSQTSEEKGRNFNEKSL